ncbi:hypothetical protein OW729_05010 [Clostridium sp. ZC22-4]|uniref:Phage portal protein n=2 Tax=Clostridium brassicae TaxID=2999072 RepID=A0ABT4D8H5_9CLOT|nr:hypothetical protein [Clostridium brassicae]
MQVPILPPTIPEISNGMENESFKTFNNGTFNFPGQKKSFSTTLELLAPNTPKRYSFCKSNEYASTMISFFFSEMYFQDPIRYIVVDDKQTIWDVKCLIGDFNWIIDSNKDYQLNITLNEWRDYNEQI